MPARRRRPAFSAIYPGVHGGRPGFFDGDHRDPVPELSALRRRAPLWGVGNAGGNPSGSTSVTPSIRIATGFVVRDPLRRRLRFGSCRITAVVILAGVPMVVKGACRLLCNKRHVGKFGRAEHARRTVCNRWDYARSVFGAGSSVVVAL